MQRALVPHATRASLFRLLPRALNGVCSRGQVVGNARCFVLSMRRLQRARGEGGRGKLTILEMGSVPEGGVGVGGEWRLLHICARLIKASAWPAASHLLHGEMEVASAESDATNASTAYRRYPRTWPSDSHGTSSARTSGALFVGAAIAQARVTTRRSVKRRTRELGLKTRREILHVRRYQTPRRRGGNRGRDYLDLCGVRVQRSSHNPACTYSAEVMLPLPCSPRHWATSTF